MDDILGHLEAALRALMGKAVVFCLELLASAGRKALELAAQLADAFARAGAALAGMPLWVTIPATLLLLGLVLAYVFRQPLYDRVLVYHLVWLKRRGFSRQTFAVQRGALRQTRQAMARQLPLPDRFSSIAVYDVHPGQYAVAYGPVNGHVEDLRFYRRELRSGLSAMADDLAAYFRANARGLHADSELRALFAVLDAADPAFFACRAALPGEQKEAAPGAWPRAAS